MSSVRGVLLAVASALMVAGFAAEAHAAAAPVWLCKPGMADNPCVVSQKTAEFSPTNQSEGTVTPHAPASTPPVDCFYVYPTVSDQMTPIANLETDPEERSIALYQAARYAPYCRMYAPIYRQVTVPALNGATPAPTDAQRAEGYDDVLAAWNYYLAHYNHGRGVILLGHSQGSFELRALMTAEVDKKASERKLLISAVLLGGNVLVKDGSDRGGDFQKIPACRSASQLGCVIAFSTFDQTPPSDSLFGRATGGIVGANNGAGQHVLCTNPAALGGGPAVPLDSIFPTRPFAPGSLIATGIALLGQTVPKTSAPWIEYRDAYSGRCETVNGATVLIVEPHSGTTALTPSPTPEWGLHLVDANIALGDIVDDLKTEIAAWVKQHPAAKPKH